MRVFLILLIVANLGYLTWQQEWLFARPEARSNPGQQQSFQPTERGLVLLSELPQERRDLMSSLAEARTVRAGAQQQLRQAQEEIAEVEGDIGENASELAQDQARSAEVQEALLETLDAAVAETAEAPVVAEPVTPWCADAGVFADQGAAQSYVNSLQALGVDGVIKLREEPISSTWWVHMPAFATEAEARERLAELQTKNIDSYYMRSGEMAGGISLGVYSRPESAQIAQQQLANQGYATTVREVFRMGQRLYVELVMPDATLREAPEWTGFLASAGRVGLVEKACEMIASENEFP